MKPELTFLSQVCICYKDNDKMGKDGLDFIKYAYLNSDLYCLICCFTSMVNS